MRAGPYGAGHAVACTSCMETLPVSEMYGLPATSRFLCGSEPGSVWLQDLGFHQDPWDPPPTQRAPPGKGGGHEAAPRMQATPGGVPQSRSPWAELEEVMGRRDPAYLQMWEGHSGRGNSLCEGKELEDRAGWWLPRWVLRRRQWWGPQDRALAEGLQGAWAEGLRSPPGASREQEVIMAGSHSKDS